MMLATCSRGSWNMVKLKQQNESFNLNLFVHVHVHKCAQIPQHTFVEVNWESWFSSATQGSVPRIKLRLSDLVANSFTHRAVSLPPI